MTDETQPDTRAFRPDRDERAGCSIEPAAGRTSNSRSPGSNPSRRSRRSRARRLRGEAQCPRRRTWHRWPPEPKSPFDQAFGPPDNARDYDINYARASTGLTPRIWSSSTEGDQMASRPGSFRRATGPPSSRPLWTRPQARSDDPGRAGSLEGGSTSAPGQIRGERRKCGHVEEVAEQVLDFGDKQVTDVMRAAGGMHDASVIRLLARHGERMAYRRQLK